MSLAPLYIGQTILYTLDVCVLWCCDDGRYYETEQVNERTIQEWSRCKQCLKWLPHWTRLPLRKVCLVVTWLGSLVTPSYQAYRAFCMLSCTESLRFQTSYMAEGIRDIMFIEFCICQMLVYTSLVLHMHYNRNGPGTIALMWVVMVYAFIFRGVIFLGFILSK